MTAVVGYLRRSVWALVPNVYAAIIAFAAALASAFLVYLMWVWLFEASDPITEDSVVETRPAGARVVSDGDAPAFFGLTRHLCSDRTAVAEVIRNWTDHLPMPAAPDGTIPQRPMGELVLATSVTTIVIRKGCHRYAAEGPVPRHLPPGIYTYEAELRFRVPPFPDVLRRLAEVDVTIERAGPPR